MSSEEQPAPEVRERLMAEVGRAVEAAGEAAASLRHEAAGPGDLYAFTATAAHDVEWLLAATDPERPDRFRAVAADTEPWLGGADVELPDHPGTGPLVARCRHWLWLAGDDLRRGRRTGRVPAAAVAEVEERCRQGERDQLDPGPLARETDDDPEYKDRDEELADARQALVASLAGSFPADGASGQPPPREAAALDPGGRRGMPSAAGTGEPVGPGDEGQAGGDSIPPKLFASARQGSVARRPSWRAGWAAAALLAVALGLTAWLAVDQGRRLTHLEEQLRRRDRPASVVSGRSFLVGSTVRSGEGPLVPATAAGQLILPMTLLIDVPYDVEIVEPVEPGEPPVTRLRIATRQPAPDRPDQLDRFLVWPADAVPPGLYEIRVYAGGDEGRRLLARELLRIPAPPEPASDGGGGAER